MNYAVSEFTRDESFVISNLEAWIKNMTGIPAISAAIHGQKWDWIEGQYKGKYYFEKKQFDVDYMVIVGNDKICVRFWIKDSEIHIYSMEVDKSLRRNGMGSFILRLFQAMASKLQYKITLRAEPIEFFSVMNRTNGKKYGPKLYKRYAAALDKRIDELILFYEKNWFKRCDGVGVCFEWSR